MLLDFTVANYRSIKEPVTLSAVAQKQRHAQSNENSKRKRVKPDDKIASTFSLDEWDFEVLPTVGIFGANASGKSNVVQAIDCLISLINFGHADERLQTFTRAKITSFNLDSSTIGKPTTFKLRFVANLAIYTYSLSLNQTQIFSEILDYELASTKRSRCLFRRIWNHRDNKFDWKHGSDFKGPHLQLRKSLKKSELFLSILDSLNIEIITSLQNWFRFSLSNSNQNILGFEQAFILTAMADERMSHDLLKRITQIIKKFDTGIVEIEVRKSNEMEDGINNIYALHKSIEGNTVRWLFKEESLGTQRLFNFAFRLLLALDKGCLLILDEISANIHPNITRAIIQMFQSEKSNPNHAQLIFTSHDNTLQRNNLLRRDQIWFTQKKPDHSTELYPLTDFKVRNDLAIDKAYLDGRFGAVPILPSEGELLSEVEDL